MNLFRPITIALLAAATLTAQTNRGGISGTVSDPSGAVVPHASVTVTNIGTNQAIKTVTSDAGSYSVSSLDPVLYNVVVESPGFKRSAVDNVKVETASVATVNVTLQTGQVSSEVTVQASAVLVNTESGTTSSTVTERQIQDIPLVNRSVLDLALTQPNVMGDAGSEDPVITTVTTCPGCNLSLNGGRPLNTVMMADGTNNTGVSLARTMVSFSPETVQEFTVQTSVFSAEFSSTGGGVINATTKSGTNTLTGTVLWYNRNPDLAAAPFTLATVNRPPATLKYNQFSIAAGGPVYIPKIYNGRDKTFWFAAVEPQYRRDELDQYALVPTDAMRHGDFSNLVNTAGGFLPASVAQQFNQPSIGDATIYQQFSVANGNQFAPLTLPAGAATFAPFPNNVIPPSLLDTTAVKALTYLTPAPTSYYINSAGQVSNLDNPRLLSQNETRVTAKIDQIFGNSHISGRYTSTPIIRILSFPVASVNNTADYSYAKQALLTDTHTFSPTIVNDLRLNYTRGVFTNSVAPQFDAYSGANLNTLLGLPNLTPGGEPSFTGLGVGSGTGVGIGNGGNNEDKEERYEIADTVYKTAGKMSWKIGVDLSKSIQNIIPLSGALGGSYSFNALQTNSTGASSGTGGIPFASFLLGVPNGNVTLRNAIIPYYYRWNAAAAFVQNDWKVRPNLTLNIGVRWNLELPRTEKYDNQGVFRPDLAQSVPLASPLTLADGEVLTSALIPPFAFSGRGGNSKYLTPPQYADFEPRFGFAWSPAALTSRHITIRGGYGLAHAPITGSFRAPQPDFGATSGFASTVPSATANPNYLMRLGENPPVIIAQTPAQVINAPANGMVYQNSLYYQATVGGYAVSTNYHTPYVQNWNLTTSWQASSTTTVELSYTGLKGTHLFLAHEDINPKDVPLLSAQNALNVSTTTTINDPLGRINPGTGKILTVQNGSLGSPYLGFSSLYQLFDASADSIRHGGSVSMIHRVGRGLTLTANYTYAKSIDDSSSSGGDKNVLTNVNGYTDGQVALGGTRKNDRSVSTFDERHVLNTTFIYDLPVGRGRALLSHAWKPAQFVLGDWTMTGSARFHSGFPYMPVLTDTNQLGDLTNTVRPNLVPGVPVVNPQWSLSCPTGTNCPPYLNPAAFERPPIGQLGNAPRTLDNARGPWVQTFDLSLQKNFKLGESGKRKFSFAWMP